MCSLSVTAESLAGLGLVLSNGGRHPETGERLIDKYAVQVAKTIMLTCGMYDGSGEFAVRVGILQERRRRRHPGRGGKAHGHRHLWTGPQ